MNDFFRMQTFMGSHQPGTRVAFSIHCGSARLHLVCPQSAEAPFDDGNPSHYLSRTICLGLQRRRIITHAAWSLQFWKPSKLVVEMPDGFELRGHAESTGLIYFQNHLFKNFAKFTP